MSDPIQLPHAPIAEKSVLSVMFRRPSFIARAAAEGISADAFHLPSNREILAGLVRSRDAGHLTDDGEIDLSVIVQAAAIDGSIERMGGASEIYAVSTYAIGESGWTAWCDQLRECKARRIAILAGQKIGGGDMDAEEAIKATRDALESMQRAFSAKTRSMNAKAACEEFIAAYVASSENGDIPGESSGIGEIDAITGGLKRGELWVVGGPSSSGKSVLMYQVGSEFLGNGRVVAIFSAELMAREIVGRLVTLRARVDYNAITNPREVTKGDIVKIQHGIAEMAQTRMWIDTSAGQSIDSIASESERIRDMEGRIDLIVVDYIQIIKGIRSKGDTREMEIASISGGLKQLAKKMDCPVITGTQLTDDGKTRESRAIEQDSDVLMIIGESGVLMKKVRNGQRDVTVPISLDGSKQKFRYFRPEN